MVYFSELLQRAVYRITYYDKTRYCGVREYAIVYQTDLIYLLIYIYRGKRSCTVITLHRR